MTQTVIFRLFLAMTLGLSLGLSATNNAQAQMQTAGAMPQFSPMSGWNVEPTSLTQIRGLSGIKLPCMMAANYDNGYIVRISGGSGAMLAMAIDFRQSVFHQGRQYKAQLTLNGAGQQAVRATAFSESVLIFNLRPVSGFYSSLQGASHMQLDIEGNSFGFGLGGVSAAIQDMEACYNSDTSYNSGTAQNVSTMPTNIAPPAKWEDEAPRVSKSERRRNTNQGGPSGMTVWEASAGDDMQQTLESWGKRAGVAVDWQATERTPIVNDIRVSGSFTDAVQTLMAQNAAVTGIEANLQQGGSSRQVSSQVSSAPRSILPSYAASSAGQDGGGSAKWYAPEGSNLQQVLDIWSKQEGVDVIWQSNTGFSVKRGVNANGTYESALQSLLNQYSGDSIRPAAQLNNDPVTGRRVLIIDATRV